MPENLPSESTETPQAGSSGLVEESGRSPVSVPHSFLEDDAAGSEKSTTDRSAASGEYSRAHFEPIEKYPYDLSYACLMIPRFATHDLSGDLVGDLYNWIHRACISFGWRLESVNIQPGYLQWILNVPPLDPPALIIRVIRQYTSKQIFEDYPRFKKENISGDFWAPGHLVIVGRRPHTQEMIEEFIRLTRQQQGIKFIHRR